MNTEQMQIVKRIARHILATISEVGVAPASAIYLALQEQGATLNQFNSIMTTLVEKGYVTSENDAYQITDKIL
tara:strand:- start:511 stop:729 length:219 start_codon:yes stop_codon:yes gene_type:complete